MNGWTEADQAELDVLLWELVGCVHAHRESCTACVEARADGRRFCRPVSEAIEAVLDWRRRRALLSRAEYSRVKYLRRLQELAGPELVAERELAAT